MNDILERRLEFLKLEAKGFTLCEIVKVLSEKPATILSMDGQLVAELACGDLIMIRRSRRSIRLMHLAGSSFCETLRRKLHWRGATL